MYVKYVFIKSKYFLYKKIFFYIILINSKYNFYHFFIFYSIPSKILKINILEPHFLLINTYYFLILTLIFSYAVSTLSMIFFFPVPNFLLMILCAYTIIFLIYKIRDTYKEIFLIFIFTGLLSFYIGTNLNFLKFCNINNIILIIFFSSSTIFFCCSIWILITQKNMLFLSTIIPIGFIFLFLGVIINYFLKIPALYFTIGFISIIFSSGSILLETNRIIFNIEISYIRATVIFYISLYNIFVNLLNFFDSFYK